MRLAVCKNCTPRNGQSVGVAVRLGLAIDGGVSSAACGEGDCWRGNLRSAESSPNQSGELPGMRVDKSFGKWPNLDSIVFQVVGVSI